MQKPPLLAISAPEGGEGLKCDACKLVYRVKDDIPEMLIDEAIKL